jgi:hypothetical protein
MRNLFHRRGHNGRLTLSTLPTTRLERWRAQFEEGRGPLFYGAVLMAAVGLWGLLWAVLAVGVAFDL